MPPGVAPIRAPPLRHALVISGYWVHSARRGQMGQVVHDGQPRVVVPFMIAFLVHRFRVDAESVHGYRDHERGGSSRGQLRGDEPSVVEVGEVEAGEVEAGYPFPASA
jgi:hypothetical protein